MAVNPHPSGPSIDRLLQHVVANGASDLHLTVGSRPTLRIHGTLKRIEEEPVMTPEMTREMFYRILSTEQQKHLEINRQLDLAYSVPGMARFRVNIYSQRESLAGAFRLIPTELKTLEELGLPSQLHELTKRPRRIALDDGTIGELARQ